MPVGYVFLLFFVLFIHYEHRILLHASSLREDGVVDMHSHCQQRYLPGVDGMVDIWRLLWFVSIVCILQSHDRMYDMERYKKLCNLC
jgi:hypothetical protein